MHLKTLAVTAIATLACAATAAAAQAPTLGAPTTFKAGQATPVDIAGNHLHHGQTIRKGTRLLRWKVTMHGKSNARVTLSDGERLDVDFVVFATGYRADLATVGYLSELVGDGVAVQDGFPVLDESFGSTVPGLYVAGFPTTRDFGPFFGFVRGAVPTAALVVEDLLARP